MWLFSSFYQERSPDRRPNSGDSQCQTAFYQPGDHETSILVTCFVTRGFKSARLTHPAAGRSELLHIARGLWGFLQKKTTALRHGTEKRSHPVKHLSLGRSKDSPSTYSWSCFDYTVLRTYLLLQRSRSNFLAFSSQGIRQKPSQF